MSDASRERRKSRAPGLTDRRPIRVLTMTGKKVIRAAMRTLGPEPKPNQMTKRGATATTGVTLTRSAMGRRVRSAALE